MQENKNMVLNYFQRNTTLLGFSKPAFISGRIFDSSLEFLFLKVGSLGLLPPPISSFYITFNDVHSVLRSNS
jgi:hypothetical protein